MQFMTHPEHGATDVALSAVAAHEAHGWVISTHAEWLGKKAAVQEDSTEQQPKRRGRKPKDASWA